MFPGETAYILIVAQFPLIRNTIKDQLRNMGFTFILEASRGEAALDLLSKKKVEAVISDADLPDFSGLKLLTRIRAEEALAHTPFIMITSGSNRQEIIQAIQLKVSELLIKPFTQACLEKKINLVMQFNQTARAACL